MKVYLMHSNYRHLFDFSFALLLVGKMLLQGLKNQLEIYLEGLRMLRLLFVVLDLELD